jgi:hypothetical protein
MLHVAYNISQFKILQSKIDTLYMGITMITPYLKDNENEGS